MPPPQELDQDPRIKTPIAIDNFSSTLPGALTLRLGLSDRLSGASGLRALWKSWDPCPQTHRLGSFDDDDVLNAESRELMFSPVGDDQHRYHSHDKRRSSRNESKNGRCA